MTKKEMFAEIITLATAQNRTDIVDFAKHEVELLSKRATSKPSAKVTENEGIKKSILEILTAVGKPMTITQLTKEPALMTYTPNKVSALMTQLKDNHKVERSLVKKVAYFSVPAVADATSAEVVQ